MTPGMPDRSPELGSYYVGQRGPVKVRRDGATVDLVPGDLIPEAFAIRPDRRAIDERRGKFVWRARPIPSPELVQALMDARSDEAVAEALKKHGITGSVRKAFELPTIDPELRAYWEKRQKVLREKYPPPAKAVRAKVAWLDPEVRGQLEKSAKPDLLEEVIEAGTLAETMIEALNMPEDRKKLRKAQLVDLVGLLRSAAELSFEEESNA
jgi:hypothetical protein